jgi:hypothetical protein
VVQQFWWMKTDPSLVNKGVCEPAALLSARTCDNLSVEWIFHLVHVLNK